MNLSDKEIEIILFSTNVLERYKDDFLPADKIKMVSSYLNESEFTLKKKHSVSDRNSIAAMHLACSAVAMIIAGDLQVDIFTKNRCLNYADSIFLLIAKLQNALDSSF